MIQITKDRKGPMPEGLKKGVERAEELLKEYNAIAEEKITKAVRLKKESEWLAKLKIESKEYATEDVKKQLYISHFGKCAYCETRILHSHYGDVEHYRPKKGVDVRTEEGKSLTITDAYFWHAFNWDNLVLSCGICNQYYKKNYFELLPDLTPTKEEEEYSGEGLLKIRKVEPLRQNPSRPKLVEKPVLIDVCLENPRLFISFDPQTGEAGPSKHINLTGGDSKLAFARAAKTIKILGLNRIALLDLRRRHLLLLHAVFLVALNDRYGWETIRKLGEEYKKEPLLDTQGEILAKHLAAHSGSRKETQKAVELLSWYVRPGGEYSALACDAVCQWSFEEYQQEIKYSGKISTQSIDDRSLFVGGTVNEFYKIPISFLHTQNIQFTDYKKVTEFFLKEHDYITADPNSIRKPLYQRMNELVERYEKNFKSLEEFMDWKSGRRRLRKFKEHVGNYEEQLNNYHEQFEGETDYIKIIEKFSNAMSKFFNEAKLLRNSLEAKDLYEKKQKYFGELEKYFNEIISKVPNDKKAQITFNEWKGDFISFVKECPTYLDEATFFKSKQPEFFEDVTEEFHSILLDLTELLFDVNTCGLACSPITDKKTGRAEKLKTALNAILDYLKKPTVTMPEMEEIALITKV